MSKIMNIKNNQKRWEAYFKLCNTTTKIKSCGDDKHIGCGARQPDRYNKEATYDDWASRQYKQNKGMIFLGGDDVFGEAKSIGSINEGRRQRVLRGAKMQMDEAIETLKELRLTDEEISNLLNNKMATGRTTKRLS